MAEKEQSSRYTSGKDPLIMRLRMPLMFHFQPEDIEIIRVNDTERLKEWEALMAERVGIRLSMTDIDGSATISRCGGTPCD
jgi:hypothetical protein